MRRWWVIHSPIHSFSHTHPKTHTPTGGINQILFLLNKEYKQRLLRHEAGHFLVGYLCGLPVLSYSVSGRLNAVEFAQILSFGKEQAQGLEESERKLAGPAPKEEWEKFTPRGVLTGMYL